MKILSKEELEMVVGGMFFSLLCSAVAIGVTAAYWMHRTGNNPFMNGGGGGGRPMTWAERDNFLYHSKWISQQWKKL